MITNFNVVSSSAKAILDQWRAFQEVKAAAKLYGTPDFASRIAMQSILRHERDLSEEFEAAKRGERLARHCVLKLINGAKSPTPRRLVSFGKRGKRRRLSSAGKRLANLGGLLPRKSSRSMKRP